MRVRAGCGSEGRDAMDAPGCMKALLLAATEYRAAKTAHNAALLQRSLEVRAAPVPRARRERAGMGGAVVYVVIVTFYGVFVGLQRCVGDLYAPRASR